MMRLPIDKQAHFLAGYCIAMTAALLLPAWYGFLISTVAGLLKETYDHISKRGTPDRWDALATMLGALAGEIIFQVIKG